MLKSLFLLFLLLSTPAIAADVVPTSLQQVQLSYAPLVRQVAPAVVSIYAKRVVNERLSPFMNDPFFSQFFGNSYGFGVPRQRVESALGSGVIVSASGLIITNKHVIADAEDVVVVLSDRREFPATIVSVDDKTDLAALRITAPESLPALTLANSDDLEVGDLVLAIGNPFGVGQTVTSGIISATGRSTEGLGSDNLFIQTDAAINPGNSGGALVDMSGRLIGINTAIYSKSGGSMGIGFAVPANMVQTVITAAASGQRLRRPWLGLEAQPITAELASSLGLPRPEGVIIKSLHPASPAAKAGLEVGDVVLSVDGKEVDGPEALKFRVATQAIGSETTWEVLQNGKSARLTFTLIAQPDVPARQETVLRGQTPFSGARVANLNPALVEELGLTSLTEGVIVLAVGNGTIAQNVGLRLGDIILSINRQQITTVDDLQEALGNSRGAWALRIRRGDQVISTVIR